MPQAPDVGPRDRRARVDEHRVTRREPADEIDHRPSASPSSPPHAREADARFDTRARASAAPSSEQVMQCSSLQAPHWITLPSTPRAPARTRRPCARAAGGVASASSSSTFERANPTWISTQSPGFALSPSESSRPTLIVAANTRHIDPGKTVGLVDELDDLPWDCQAHWAPPRCPENLPPSCRHSQAAVIRLQDGAVILITAARRGYRQSAEAQKKSECNPARRRGHA